MARLKRLALRQRVVLVIGLAVCVAVAWVWWYFGELQDAASWFNHSPVPTTTDTYFVVARRRPEHLVVPVALVILWTVVSMWLLGSDGSDGALNDD